MKGVDFPIFKSKIEGNTTRFNLNDPSDRQRYFALKAGDAVEKIRTYLQSGKTFVGYLLGKKNSGKGTYSKLFMEAVGAEHVGHVSIGDIVRDVHASLADAGQKAALTDFLKNNYRGFHDIEETIALIEGRSQSALISTELIIALLKYEIGRRPKQAIFIDGFPRGLDQVNYSLFLKDLLGYRDDPDFFVFIDVPNTVIDERMKSRVVCPLCKTPRGLKLLPTKEAGYDEATNSFYLMCDNPSCNKARMVPKEGDEFGIEPIRERLETDEKIFVQLSALQGVPKIYLRNSVPVSQAKEFVDEYEITPAYGYERDEATGRVRITESPWIIPNDEGVPSHSLLPAAVVVGMITQVARILGL